MEVEGTDLEVETLSPRECWGNLLLMSFSLFFAFTGFSGTQNLASTSLDFKEYGVNGSTALTIVYAVFALFALAGSSFVKLVGEKYAIAIQIINLTLLVGSNIYPRTWTLYPAAVLVGIGGGAMWTAQGSYTTWLASMYAEGGTSPDIKSSVGLYQGVFWGIFQATQVAGNLISSLVMHKIGLSMVFIIYVASMAIGFFISLLIVRRKGHKAEHRYDDSDDDRHQSCGEVMCSAIKFAFTEPRFALMIPISVASGIEMTFSWADLTKNWIAPSLGEDNIGYVMMVYGASDAIGSVVVGYGCDIVGFLFVFWVGAILQMIIIVFLYVRTIPEGAWTELCIILALWGLCDAVWNAGLSAAISAWFTGGEITVAFANFSFFRALSEAATFFLQDYNIQPKTKLLGVGSSIILGIICLTGANQLQDGRMRAQSYGRMDDDEFTQSIMDEYGGGETTAGDWNKWNSSNRRGTMDGVQHFSSIKLDTFYKSHELGN